MNPIFNTLMAILQKAELLSPEAAEKMAIKMQGSIHQSRYNDALGMVEEVAKDVKAFVAEPWLLHIQAIDDRLKALEKEVEASNKMVATQIAKKVKVSNEKDLTPAK